VGFVRVLFAPDSFGGTLSAAEAATAMADGWQRAAPSDELHLLPLSDGGPGFCEVISAAAGVSPVVTSVVGPCDGAVPVNLVLLGDAAYVESAQACGLSLVDAPLRDPMTQHSAGVGEAILAAISAGAHRIYVGIGGTGTMDAGAGMFAALGATAQGSPARVTQQGDRSLLLRGPHGLSEIMSIDIEPARRLLADVEIIAAVDVDVPLTGTNGAARGFGRQKFADPSTVTEDTLLGIDQSLDSFAQKVQGALEAEDRRQDPGAGAGGGLGWALSVLGAQVVSGAHLVAEAVGLMRAVAEVDLIVTGEGTLDWQSLRGKVVEAVAAAGESLGRPVLVIAGSVDIGNRELAARGISEARALTDLPGGANFAFGAPAMAVAQTAQRMAGQWTR
jgi:glycerate 2-kinase